MRSATVHGRGGVADAAAAAAPVGASSPPAGDGGDSSSSQNSETRERINYEVSQTDREIVRAAGAIKRVTVAVLVNEAVIPDADGNIATAPRNEEELSALRELVSSAVGFDETRGDFRRFHQCSATRHQCRHGIDMAEDDREVPRGNRAEQGIG